MKYYLYDIYCIFLYNSNIIMAGIIPENSISLRIAA